jgi:glycosyltransferase involved in cell wall biosynthesis
VKKIAEKSRVLCLGLDLERLDRHVPKDDSSGRCKKNIEPLLLWNHRWEHDKNPHEFFKALYAISDQGLDFQVAILGENFSQRPDEFEIARRRLGDRIVQYGYAKNFADYAACLFRADILPVTSRHDFFGMSVVEAVYCGCYPLLPKRLSYPEIFPVKNHPGNYYENFADLVEKLVHAIRNITNIRRLSLASAVDKYSWQKMAPLYDKELEYIADKKKSLHGRG